MAEDRPKRKRYPPVGPFAPALPTQAEDERSVPMAVARDITTPHDAFMPTTASHDAYTDKAPGARASIASMLPRSHEENRAAERPAGYSAIDENGFRHLLDEDGQ